MMTYRGTSALVTGASSGLGEAFARGLAERGVAVLLTALPRDGQALQEVAKDLSTRYGVRVEAVAIDLAEPDGARQLQTVADELGFEPDMLINNAGMGVVGSFAEIPLEQQLQVVRVNIEALVKLTGLYLPRMVAKGRGAVLNVASTAALLPVPYFAVYAASKAFVVSFSEALWAEGHRHGVRVVAVCPGPMAGTRLLRSETGSSPDPRGIRGTLGRPPVPREVVVDAALRAVERDKPIVVQRTPGVGLVGHLLTAARVVVPRRLWLMAAERVARWMLHQT